MTTAVATVQATEPPRILVTVEGLGTPGPNLLTNPSWESGSGGWTYPTGATVIVPASGELPPVDGTHVLKIPAGATGGPLKQDVTGLAAGDVVFAAIRAYGDTAQVVTLKITALTSGVPDAGTSTTDVVTLDPTIWQTLATSTLTLGAGHNGVRVEVIASSTSTEWRVDLAELREASTDTVSVFRVADDGEPVPLRGAVATAATSTLVLVDNEAPFGVPVYYVVEATDTAGTTTVAATSNTVTIAVSSPWITNPITGDGVALTIRDWPELSYAARRTVVDVSGRRSPLVVSDVRAAPTSTVVLITRTPEELFALRELLATGDVLLLRPVCSAVEVAYLSVGDVSEGRRTPSSTSTDPRQAGTDWFRSVALDAQHVDAPPAKIPGVGDTLLDLHLYAPTTLGDLANAFGVGATLLTIAQTPLAAS